MKKFLAIALPILVMAGAAAVYAWEVLAQNQPWQTHLFKLIAIEASMLAFLARGGRRRQRGLDFYRRSYTEEIGRAFFDSPADLRRLLVAIRHYNEDRFKPAIRTLEALRPRCRSREDSEAVLLFLALSCQDCGLPRDAIAAYRALLTESPQHTTAMRNLGLLLVKAGEFDEAEAIYRRAIELEPGEALGYHNLAFLFYRKGDFAAARPLAEEALRRQGNLRQAAALLAILAALEGDTEARQKYSQIAVANGENALDLKQTIERQLAAQAQNPD